MAARASAQSWVGLDWRVSVKSDGQPDGPDEDVEGTDRLPIYEVDSIRCSSRTVRFPRPTSPSSCQPRKKRCGYRGPDRCHVYLSARRAGRAEEPAW